MVPSASRGFRLWHVCPSAGSQHQGPLRGREGLGSMTRCEQAAVSARPCWEGEAGGPAQPHKDHGLPAPVDAS